MTVYITIPTRLAWSQRMNSELDSEAVGVRMERLACHESGRLGGASVQVNATDGSGRWRVLHWPKDALAFWADRP